MRPTVPPDPTTGDPGLVALVDTLTARLAPSGDPVPPESIVRIAASAMPHAQCIGLTVLRPDRPFTTMAASDETSVEVDRLQYRLRNGPCIDATTSADVVRSADVATDPRWPEFGPRCASVTGVRSMLSLRLPLGGADQAALNADSRVPDAFRDDDIVFGSLMAPYVALAVRARLHERDVANLRAALDTSRTIGTAVGILMASHRVDARTAFGLLRRASMDLNVKLREVADEVQQTGTLPDVRSGDARG